MAIHYLVKFGYRAQSKQDVDLEWWGSEAYKEKADAEYKFKYFKTHRPITGNDLDKGVPANTLELVLVNLHRGKYTIPLKTLETYLFTDEDRLEWVTTSDELPLPRKLQSLEDRPHQEVGRVRGVGLPPEGVYIVSTEDQDLRETMVEGVAMTTNGVNILVNAILRRKETQGTLVNISIKYYTCIEHANDVALPNWDITYSTAHL